VNRGWTDLVARLGDTVPLSVAVLVLFAVAALLAAALFWWPSWLPWRWWPRVADRSSGPRSGRRRLRLPRLRRPHPRWRPRWPRLRWRPRWPRLRWHWHWPWRRRRAPVEPPVEPIAAQDNELPDLPVATFMSLADRLAAQGRFAEAVRERLRGILRELVDRGMLQNRPGWTVTELAAMAAAAWPPVRPPLDAACATFSEIWYGQRQATAVHDGQMRAHADRVHAALLVPAGAGR
jgi:hypothetical protein